MTSAEGMPPEGWRVRALVALYPPSWRARYADEFTALLVDTGPGIRTVLDVLAGAASAWVRSPAWLHDRAARQRASVCVTLFAWTALATGAVLFAKSSTDGAMRRPGPGSLWYDGFVVSAGLSLVLLAAGGLPLAIQIAGRRKAVALLCLPVIVSPGYLVLVAVLAAVVGRPGSGVGAAWFLVLAGLGVVAAGACAAGPALAVSRVRPAGRSLSVAVVAGVAACVAMSIATIAALGYALIRAQPASAALIAYGTVMALAASIAMTSGCRGLRAGVASNPGRR
jgi:hypothetical protein